MNGLVGRCAELDLSPVNIRHVGTGVDRWGTEGDGGDASLHFSAWGNSIGIVPPPFQFIKIAGHVA